MGLARCLTSMLPGGQPSPTSQCGEPCQQLSVHENALDAIERVTISAKKIEIRLSEPIRDKHVGLRRVMVLSAMSVRTNADEAGHAKTRAAAAL